MKINHALRIAKMKKIHITDGLCTRLATVEDLMKHLHYSRSHAHKVINGDYPLKPAHQELLCFKLLGSAPGWPAGWYFDQGKLYSPTGRSFVPEDLDHYEYALNLMALYETDIRKLMARIQALEQRLEKSQARELRVYVNDEPEPRMVKAINRNAV